VTFSPKYVAGKHEFGKGVSLRFPRFVKERKDKESVQKLAPMCTQLEDILRIARETLR